MHTEALTEQGKEIFPYLKKIKDFYLAGGTAIALRLGHRLSVDFDLFCKNDISKSLLDKIKKIFPKKSITPSVNSPDELTVFVDDVKITFLKYPFPVLYKFSNYDGFNLLNLKELAATKAYTIGRRGTLKDYVDLFFLIKENKTTLNQIVKIAEKKYGDYFNARLFLEQLIYLKDIEDMDIIFLKEKAGKKELEIFFEEEIKKNRII